MENLQKSKVESVIIYISLQNVLESSLFEWIMARHTMKKVENRESGSKTFRSSCDNDNVEGENAPDFDEVMEAGRDGQEEISSSLLHIWSQMASVIRVKSHNHIQMVAVYVFEAGEILRVTKWHGKSWIF